MRVRQKGHGDLVPLYTPEKISVEGRNDGEPEAGWFFERELGGGGLLEGVWWNTPEALEENARLLSSQVLIDNDSSE